MQVTPTYAAVGIGINKTRVVTPMLTLWGRITFVHSYEKVKVKQSYYRPGQAQRVSGGWDSQISRQSAHEGVKVVSPTHRPPLPPGNIAGTRFC